MAADEGRRIELTEPVPPDDRRGPRIGVALLASLVIGFAPLRDAALGTGSFPAAVARYLACLAASVGAALLLGRLLDGAPPPPDEEAGDEPPAEGEAVSVPDDAPPGTI